MGFFFKSKRSSISAEKKPVKPSYADLDPAAYLSESPKSSTRPTSSLFSESRRTSSPSTPTSTGKSLLDDILDSFDDKKTSTFSSTRGSSDYDFFKTDSNDRNTYTSKYSTDKYSSKYSSGSTYQNNEPSYKRVYKLGSERSESDYGRNDYSSRYTNTTSSDKDTYSLYTKYLQNEDKRDSYSSSTYGSKYSSTNDRYGSSSRYGSTDSYSSKYSSNNDNIYSSKYTPSSTTSSTTYKWNSSSNSSKYTSYDDDRRNRFDDDRRNRFEDRYGSNLFDDRPEKPSWKSSLFQERSRSETRLSESDCRGKSPAQILKELRERNLETIKQKKKERGEEVSDDEEEVEPKTEPRVEPKTEHKKFIVEDSDSDSDSSEDFNIDESDDDDDIPLNVLEGGENKVESWLNIQNKKKQNMKKEVVKPKLRKVGSKASIMSNSKNNTKSSESNSVSSNSTSNNSGSTKQTKSKPEKPDIPKPDTLVRSNSASSLRPNKPNKKSSFTRSPSKTRLNTKHSSLVVPPPHPSPLVNQIKPLPTPIQMPVMGQQIITASPLVQPVMVAPPPPVMQPVMVPQFTQQFQPIFVNPGMQKPFIAAPATKATKAVAPKKGSKKKKASKKTHKATEAITPTQDPPTNEAEAVEAN